MPMIVQTSLVPAHSASLLVACGGDADDSPTAKASTGSRNAMGPGSASERMAP